MMESITVAQKKRALVKFAAKRGWILPKRELHLLSFLDDSLFTWDQGTQSHILDENEIQNVIDGMALDGYRRQEFGA